MNAIELAMFKSIDNSMPNAIPLLHQPECPANPQPNFIQIDQMYGIRKFPFPNEKGEKVSQVCINVNLRLSYKVEVSGASGQQMKEVIYDNLQSEAIPTSIIHLLYDPVKNEALINRLLSMIKFSLFPDFKLVFDIEKAKEFYKIENALEKEKEDQERKQRELTQKSIDEHILYLQKQKEGLS